MNSVGGNEKEHSYGFGPFRLDPVKRILARDGRRIPLAAKAFDTLVVLVQHSGDILTKDELMKLVWPGSFVEENNLNQQISRLRRALGEVGNGQTYIETVPRLGYRFVERVTVLPREEPDLLITRQRSKLALIREQEEEGITARGGTDSEDLSIRPAANDYVPATSVSPTPLRTIRAVRRPVKTIVAIATCLALVVGAWLWRDQASPDVPAVTGFVQLTHDGQLKSGPLFTDSQFVYFLEPDSGKNKLMRVPVIGGEPEPVLEMPIDLPEDFSPSGKELLVREMGAGTGRGAPLLRCAVPGGPCRRLGVDAGPTAWAVMDDGFIYAEREKVFAAKGDGTDPRQLLAAPGAVYALSFSPDGHLLRYLCEQKDASAFQLWEARADGTHPRLILSGIKTDSPFLRGTWTSDARYFFSFEADGDRRSLWALRAPRLLHHQTRTQLNMGLMSISAVAPTSDGSSLLALGTLDRVQILRLDARSGGFMPFLDGVSADGLAFSRNRDWVAYTTVPGNTLVRSRLDGTERRELSNGSQKALLPAWSPDGKRIAYMARKATDSGNGPYKIFVVSSEGGAAEELLPGTDDQGNPTWSPDGNSLIFSGVPWLRGFASDSTAIYRLDMHTRKVTTVVNSQGLWSPRWSPDGKFLVAETLDSRKLLLFDFSKQSWAPLAEVQGEDIDYTSWSHDSRFVFFNAHAPGGSPSLYRVDVLQHLTARVPIPKVPDQPTLLGEWFALGPDDAPMFLHDLSVQEVFKFELRLP
jgi:DNA-binding winged helix-turn-helix (wHTH) protein/Tol biopolymer transport system component